MNWTKKLRHNIEVLKDFFAFETADVLFYFLIRFFEYEINQERISLFELDELRQKVLEEVGIYDRN